MGNALQNFVDKVGPAIDAAFLNQLDLTVNQGLNSLTTKAAIAAWLGVASPVNFPIGVAQGGTGAEDAADALAALGGTSLAAVEAIYTAAYIGQLQYPQTAGETTAGVVPSNYFYQPLQPERYGAVGANSLATATVDNTTALNNWIAVLNSTAYPVSTWVGGKFYLAKPLNTITNSNITINGRGSTIVANPSTPTNAPALLITGNNLSLKQMTFNGNQSGFSGSGLNYNLGLKVTGSAPILEDVTSVNSCGWGAWFDSVAGGSLTRCNFNGNAAQGCLFDTCSYMTVTACNFNANGYGFQVSSAPPNAGASFNCLVRFRSHHMTFVSCVANSGGLDGFNTNDGSYAVKYIGCIAWGNGDGGFTIAADTPSDGTGKPGQSEYCYDLEFVDCESYDNWGSGLTFETIAYNSTIQGGRYYNNGRGCGTLAMVDSLCNGIYIGNASQGIVVSKAKCYDDRQLCVISAVSGGQLTATNWGTTVNWGVPASPNFNATAGNYPRVALYNASYVFEGYATITAESAGSVTITPTSNNGVTLSSITAGWFVSQRVQHNGVYWAAGCQGEVDMDGWGFLSGTDIRFGYKVYTYPSNGMNVINKCSGVYSVELLANPSWDASANTSWTYSGTGSAAGYSTVGANLHSGGAVFLQSTGGTAYTGVGSLIAGGTNYTQDAWVEFICTVTAATPGASISLTNSANGNVTTVNHPGGGTKQLKVGMRLPTGSAASPSISVTANLGAYFDEASLRMHYEAFDNRDYAWPTRNLAV